MDPSNLNQVDLTNQEKPKRKLPKWAIPVLIIIIISLLTVVSFLAVLNSKKEGSDTLTPTPNQTATSSAKTLPADLQGLNAQIETVENNLVDPYRDENKLTPPTVDLKIDF